jgi:N-acetylated-alpha-linked acidic dipeptidase
LKPCLNFARRAAGAATLAATAFALRQEPAAAPEVVPEVAPEVAPAPPRARELLLELTSTTRLAGTSGSQVGAAIVARHLEAAGWSVEFDEREVLLSLPRRTSVSIFPSSDAGEPSVRRMASFDPDAIPPNDLPLFNSWTASGAVRAKVVDVGHGLRADFERLRAAKVELKGAIALARYGKAYRGVKVQLAEEFGCVGVLLFTESSEDGGEKGPVWPKGPWKPDWDAQRGSILPVSSAPGDPSTPNGASGRPGDAVERLSLEEARKQLPKIPCTPIGARDARALLARLATDADGKPLGPGPVEVELDIDAPLALRRIVNVHARLQGESDELVIAGSHRDAWVRGAHDSGSGCVGLIRAAEHLGARVKSGWKPRASLQLSFWDAEEHGLIGSTEWGEANAALLREKCLAYVNSDASVSGVNFGASGTPGLLGLVRAVAERSRTADGSKSLWEDWCSRATEQKPSLGLPGAGSDDAVFAHHLCVPVLNVGFSGNEGGQYHTSFDDFGVVDRFLDPGFVGHEMLGKFLAELLVEMSARPSAGFDVAEAANAMALHARAAAGAELASAEQAERMAAAFEACSRAAGETPWSAATRPHRFYALFENGEPLAGRPWFRNALWAPALENGYGVETFPHLRRASEEARAKHVEFVAHSASQAVQRLSAPRDGASER